MSPAIWRPRFFRKRSASVSGAGVQPLRPGGPLLSGFGRRISGCRRATQKRVLGPVPSMGADALGAAFACGDWRAHRKVPSQTPEYTSSVGYGPEARGRRNGRWSPDGRPKRLRAGEQAAAAAAVTQPLLPCALFWETAATPGLYSGPCLTASLRRHVQLRPVARRLSPLSAGDQLRGGSRHLPPIWPRPAPPPPLPMVPEALGGGAVHL